MREVALTFFAGETITLQRCNKYHYPINSHSLELEFLSNEANITLDINDEFDVWVATCTNLKMKVAFWVEESESDPATIQNVDLTKVIYKKRTLPTLLTDDTTNIEESINTFACSYPLVTQEEKRFMCRMDAFSIGNEDVPMCEVNKKLGV